MKLKQLFAIAIVGILGSILIFAAVFAQGGSERPYPEGEGAIAGGSRVVVGSAEGQSEGLVGASGQLQGDAAAAWLAAAQVPDDLTLLYRFTGVTDDGEQGSGNRKAATAIHCTNLGVAYKSSLYQRLSMERIRGLYSHCGFTGRSNGDLQHPGNRDLCK